MTEPLAAQIAQHLRRAILRGDLPPGAAVKERDTAEEMGVSRTPMREAIRILAMEGLIELRPSRSPVVANPSAKEISDNIEVIVTLEELSGRLAVRHASDDEIGHIRATNARMAAAFDTADPIDRFEMDMAFHKAIAEASHNRALALTHGDYLARMWRARFLSARNRHNRDRVLQQHEAILEGLEARDADAAAEAIRRHLENLLADILKVLADENRAAASEDTLTN